ncbi:unnamed protein product [Leuciscus chuanchicus]
MRREQERLDTFQNWPLAPVSPAELAKSGFYYLGQGDRVACFSCGGQLSNWEPGDRVVSEHQRHYPNCRFVRGDRADNVPLSSLSNVSAMQQCEERSLTFVNWPSRITVRPDQLAKAGFYYVGRNDDVKCFCCDGGLRCWESGDDPWVEHAKWFPRCEYLLQEKGQEFVRQIQARFPFVFEQLLTNGDSREFVDPPVVHLGPGEDAVMMNNPAVQSALEMGFERGLVKQTVQSKILASGENYKTVQVLVCDLLSAEDEKREEARESKFLTFLKKHHLAVSQRLKSVQSLMDHLLEENVISQKEYDIIRNCTTVKQQTGPLIELVLSKGNAAAEVFRNWIKKNDVCLLREMMAQTNEAASPSQDLSDLPMEEHMGLCSGICADGQKDRAGGALDIQMGRSYHSLSCHEAIIPQNPSTHTGRFCASAVETSDGDELSSLKRPPWGALLWKRPQVNQPPEGGFLWFHSASVGLETVYFSQRGERNRLNEVDSRRPQGSPQAELCTKLIGLIS